jgi:hypothetical protein
VCARHAHQRLRRQRPILAGDLSRLRIERDRLLQVAGRLFLDEATLVYLLRTLRDQTDSCGQREQHGDQKGCALHAPASGTNLYPTP